MIFKTSVVIPLYNKADYIQRAVTSVLAQELACDEIIIVDDGSTDTSVARVEALASDKIKIIRQKNQGVSAARNAGIRASQYSYVLFLDADDIWLPHFTREIADLAQLYPDAGLLASAYAFKELNALVPARLKALPKDKGLIADYFLSCLKADLPVTASSVAIKKEVLHDVGGFALGMKMGEDQLLWSRVAYQYPMAFSNRISVHYDRTVIDSACKTHLITELAPHISHWKADIQEGKVPERLLPGLRQLLHFSALYCVKNNLKLNQKSRALTILFKEPLLKKDHYWYASILLACLPQFIIKRVL